ncbi:MAG: hypothetical protein ACOYLM_12100 [Methylococcaceae bacterium]
MLTLIQAWLWSGEATGHHQAFDVTTRANGVNVLTPQKHSAVVVLLERRISQHEIKRKTGVDPKTVRKIAQSLVDGPSNSPMATGFPPEGTQNPPPRPPAIAQSACEIHREWIEAQRRLGRNAMVVDLHLPMVASLGKSTSFHFTSNYALLPAGLVSNSKAEILSGDLSDRLILP